MSDLRRQKLVKQIFFRDKEFIIRLISCIGLIIYYPIRWWKRRSFHLSNIKKILVIACNHGIGTYMLLTPMLKSLKANMPDCHICLLLSSKIIEEIAKRSDCIDEVILCEELLSLRMLQGILFFRKKIAPKKFDLAISTIYETSSKNAIWSFFSGAAYRIGFNKNISAFSDTFTFGWDENTHEVQRYLNILRFFGMNYLNDELVLSLSEDDETFADEFLDSYAVSEEDILLGIHPGAKKGWFQKIWPLDRFVEVAVRFSNKFGAKIIFFGGPDETEIFSKLPHSNHRFIHSQQENRAFEGADEQMLLSINCNKLRTKVRSLVRSRLLILANNQNITQTSALIKRCSLFLSNDSGLMHIAAAAKVPVVAIFGPTIVSKNRPWNVVHTVIRKELPCSPCYHYQDLECLDVKCLDLINTEEVLEALCKLYLETQLNVLQGAKVSGA